MPRNGPPPVPKFLALTLASWALLTAPAVATDPIRWDRLWGGDVVAGNAEIGFEICTVAADCDIARTVTYYGGTFNDPQGVATDASGNVYVGNFGLNRIDTFDASGNFLAAWGIDVDDSNSGSDYEICTVSTNCGNGTFDGTGGATGPVGIALDANGNLYAATPDNLRIDKYDSTGHWVRAWGKDVVSGNAQTGYEVCTVAADCQQGTAGTLGGEFANNSPRGVAVDTTGAVYVSDTANNRIQKFDSNGNFLRTWGFQVDTSQGNAYEICTVAANCKAGLRGGGQGFADPGGLAIGPNDEVYIPNSVNAQIIQDDKDGNFVRVWGKDVDNGNPGSGAEVCTQVNRCQSGDHGSLGGEFADVEWVATDAAGNVFVAEHNFSTTHNTRIQEFDNAYQFVRAWGVDVVAGNAETGFETCTVAANCRGGEFGSGLGGEPDLPTGIATGAGSIIYLADEDDDRVMAYAPAGVLGTVAQPTFTSTSPASPANNNSPKLIGTAPTGATVTVYDNSACTGSPVATGTQAAFASPGLSLTNPLTDDTSTTFYAKATKSSTSSACSTSSISYVEDSTAPSAPSITSSDPATPAGDPNPKLIGTAEASSTVRLYKDNTCSGSVAATGTAAAFASPGLAATVAANSSTNFYATATDAAGNTSSCSSAFTYVESEVVITGSDPASPANENNPKIKGTAPAGATVDLYANNTCSGSPVATGTDTDFASLGFSVTVADNSSTTFRAKSTVLGVTSPCSASSFVYVEDSAVSPPVFTGTNPASPSTNDHPKILGAAEAGSTVTLYTNDTCTSSVAATGTAAAFASPGLTVTVAHDADTTFWGKVTDASNNVSACSSLSIVYTHASVLPVNQTPPQMVGTPKPGSLLTCLPGTWTNNPTLSYRFVHSLGGGPFMPVNGSGSAIYTPTDADVGSDFRCEEIAQVGSGPIITARSNVKQVAPDRPVNAVVPAVNGQPIVGQTLTCDHGTWSNLPLTFTYRWYREGTYIADGAQHVVAPEDRETHLSCDATGTNDVGIGDAAASPAVFAILDAPVNTANPVLTLDSTGPRPTDKRATCNPGTWRDDPHDYSFEIDRADGGVVATTPTHDITVDDLGQDLLCKVTAHNIKGSADATSAVITVPLPPVQGNVHFYKAGEFNQFDPVNLLVSSDGVQEGLKAFQTQRVQQGYDSFRAYCQDHGLTEGVFITGSLHTTDDRKRTAAACKLVFHTPADQIVIAPDGVHVVADPGKCVLGSADPCAALPIPLAAASDVLQPAGIDPGVVPERVLWDLNNDGRVDASCPGSAPVLRSIFKPGAYNLHATIVLPDSAKTGIFPGATVTLNHFNPTLDATGLIKYLVAGGGVPGSSSGPALGTLRKSQPFACRTALERPADITKPCVSAGTFGSVDITGNLCPISLRSIPPDEVDALKKSDSDVYNLLVAQNETLGANQRRAARGSPPVAQTPQLSAGPLSAINISMQQIAGYLPSVVQAKGATKTLFQDFAKKYNLDQAASALDQIYISRGRMTINGVDLTPINGHAAIIVPSDAGDAVEAVKDMIVSSAQSNLSLDGIPLVQDPTKPFKQNLNDAVGSVAQELSTVNFDELSNRLKAALDLGPFDLAGDATVKLVDGAAILDAYAELKLLSTGAGPPRAHVTIKATPDGKIVLSGLQLQVPEANLGVIRLRGLDIRYDGGLSVKGQLLIQALGGAGIDIKQFHITHEGTLDALILDYLAGAGQGIPAGPGIFLTKLGGGLSYTPTDQHIQADAAISVGPSAGGGCPVVGADGTIRLQFTPRPLSLDSNVDMEIACFGLAHVDFHADETGYVHLGASMGFDEGPLFFNAHIDGAINPDHWQVSGGGEGGVRGLPLVGTIKASVEAVISDSGLAGCGSIDTALGDVAGGAGIHWNPALLLGPASVLANIHLFTGCDLSEYKTIPGVRAVRDGVAKTISVAGGERALVLSVEGLGAAPHVALKGPDGTIVDLTGTEDAVHTDAYFGSRAEDEDRSIFFVAKPTKGAWTIEPSADSVQIARIQRAGLLPKPKIKASVAGRGPKRVLKYSIAPINGQVVRFTEEAARGGQVLKTVKRGGKGTVRFVVAIAPGTPARKVVAQVSQDGLPRANIVVAKYTAPDPKVGRATKLRIRRRGTTAVVTWGPALLATHYDVVVARGAGARLLIRPAKGIRKVTVTKLPKRTPLRVTVIGYDRGGRPGPAAKATLRAARGKHKRH